MTDGIGSHPVWEVYDQHRTARLNVRYHCVLLERLRRHNFMMELLLAISAPSSAVAGLWFWQAAPGELLWKTLGILTAVLAVSKPLLRWTDKINDLNQILTGYRALDHDLQFLAASIHQDNRYGKVHKRRFRECMEMKKELIEKSIGLRERKNLKRRCQDEVLSELPVEYYHVPKEN